MFPNCTILHEKHPENQKFSGGGPQTTPPPGGFSFTPSCTLPLKPSPLRRVARARMPGKLEHNVTITLSIGCPKVTLVATFLQRCRNVMRNDREIGPFA